MTAKPIAKIQTHAFYKRDREVENKDTVKIHRKDRRKQRKKQGRGELERGKKEGKTKLNSGNRRQSLGPAQDRKF